jgi:hypothetical protein
MSIPHWGRGVNAQDSRTRSPHTANDRFAAQGSMAGHGRMLTDTNVSRLTTLSSHASCGKAVVRLSRRGFSIAQIIPATTAEVTCRPVAFW